jgi:hypothetical protein
VQHQQGERMIKRTTVGEFKQFDVNTPVRVKATVRNLKFKQCTLWGMRARIVEKHPIKNSLFKVFFYTRGPGKEKVNQIANRWFAGRWFKLDVIQQQKDREQKTQVSFHLCVLSLVSNLL